MKEQIKNLIKNVQVIGKKAVSGTKFVAGANLFALIFTGFVNAEDLPVTDHNAYCSQKYDLTSWKRTGKDVEKDGCECEKNALVDGSEVLDFFQVNCHAKRTQEEKALAELIENHGYRCVDDACKTLVDLKCAKVEVPNIYNGLTWEEYSRIVQKAKQCHVSADKMIKQVINNGKIR